MPLLKKTESRLPAIYPEDDGGAINYFNNSNAALLGFFHLDRDYCLVSYLPATIKTLTGYLHLQNHYVVFIKGLPGTNYDYSWSIEYSFKNGVPTVIFTETEASQNIPTYQLDSRRQGLAEANVSDLKEIKVSCEVRQVGSLLSTLELTHRMADPDADVLALTNTGHIAEAGNVPATFLVSNLVRDYYPLKPKWQDAHINSPPPANSSKEYGDPIVNPSVGSNIQFVPPLNYPAAVLYARILKSSLQNEKKDYFPPLNTEYYTLLNSGNLSLQKEARRNLVGPCVIAPHLAALYLGKLSFNVNGATNFVYIGDNNGTEISEQDIFDAFNTLSDDEKVDIYNLARFPKSGFLLSARMMTTLFEKAVEKSHMHFKGNSNDVAIWHNDVAGSVEIDDYARNIYFEYFNGPQEKIGTWEIFWRDCKLKKAVGKVHAHDYSAYIKKILERSYFTGTVEVKQAFFARRKIAIAANGDQTVTFDPISQSVLGRQEYLLVETDGLPIGQGIQVSIKTGDTRLTGTIDETLTLIENGSPQANFVANVGDQTELTTETGVAFINAGNFAKYAIFKVGLRSNQEAIFNTWNGNIPADGTADAALAIEVKLDEPPLNVGLIYAEDAQFVQASNATHTFLTDPANTFTVGHLDKSTVPRIVNAYFAKKVVTSAAGVLTVDFEQIPEPANANERSHIIGRFAYLVVETQNLQGNDIEIYVRAGNTVLTGTANENLLVAPMQAGNQPTHFTAQPIGTGVLNDDALHDNAGNNPYTNMATHEDKIVLKVDMRPSGPNNVAARVTFNSWCANIQASPAIAATIELKVKPVDPTQDVYYYFGPVVYEEVMRNWNSHVFLDQAGQRFTVENSTVYEIHHIVAGALPAAPLPPAFLHHAYNMFPTHNVDGAVVRRPIGKIDNGSTNLVTYFFFDAIDNEHELCRTTSFVTTNKQRQNAIPALAARGALINTVNYGPNVLAQEQIYAQTLEIYANGTLGTPSVFGANQGWGNLWYANVPGQSTMIDADIDNVPGIGPMNFVAIDYNNNANTHGEPVVITFAYHDTRRRSANPDLFAGFLGSLAQLHDHPNTIGILVLSAGFSYEDGSSYPSSSHVNGNAVDTSYLANLADQNLFVAIMRAYGIRGHGRGNSGWQPNIQNAGFLAGHNDHLHSYQFDNGFIHTIF